MGSGSLIDIDGGSAHGPWPVLRRFCAVMTVLLVGVAGVTVLPVPGASAATQVGGAVDISEAVSRYVPEAVLTGVAEGVSGGGNVSDATVASVTKSVGMVRSAGVMGSGWLADRDTVVTNLHVAKAGSGDIYVDFSDGERVECYTAVADRNMDLAILRCPSGARRPVAINTVVPAADTPIAVVGYPGGEGPTITRGAIRSERPVARGITTVSFSAAIAGGSSGSPVFDSEGRVRAVATFAGGYGVPIAKLTPLLRRAKSYPATKQGAEWRLRIRRSVIVGTFTLLVAWFFARRNGRNNPWRVALRWTVVMVLVTLAITQLLFAAHGPASFI